MSFDLAALRQTVDRHGKIARVVVARTKGSTPRPAGTSMLVWSDGQSGTIGGGGLEFEATRLAREAISSARDSVVKLPLGPAFGQCCGGHVTLLIEHWDTARLNGLPEDLFARALPGEPREMPLVLRRQIADQRSQGLEPAFFFGAGWIAEPIAAEAQSLWIYGAGHVGRALVSVLAPLPEIQITWVDTGADRFPDEIPNGVVPLVSRNPADVVCHAPNDADHLILTYSHAFDLELCHQLLVHGFRSAGLIGSETKWARFQSRLSQLGHPSADILRIACPIGDPSLGKHPQAIAVGVANAILRQTMEISAARGMRA